MRCRNHDRWVIAMACIGFFIGTTVIFGAIIVDAYSAAKAPKDTCAIVTLAVVVNLDNDKTPESIAHVRAALERGEARILHLDRDSADEHRTEALRGVPTKPGFDRDEYPPAFSREGGTGADVRYVASRDNRSSGSRMGAQLRPFCEGQAFIVEP